MTTYKVHMTRQSNDQKKAVYREVELPTFDVIQSEMGLVGKKLSCLDIAEAVFHYGQNEVQPVKDRYSVSVGDVILLNKKTYAVASVGFVELDFELYGELLSSDDPYWFMLKYSDKFKHENNTCGR